MSRQFDLEDLMKAFYSGALFAFNNHEQIDNVHSFDSTCVTQFRVTRPDIKSQEEAFVLKKSVDPETRMAAYYWLSTNPGLQALEANMQAWIERESDVVAIVYVRQLLAWLKGPNSRNENLAPTPPNADLKNVYTDDDDEELEPKQGPLT